MPAFVSAVASGQPFLVQLTDDLGHTWGADEPADLGGANAAPPPDRLLLGSLGACTIITLQMVAQRKAWPLSGVRVQLQLNPDGKPGSGTDIERQITLEGELDEEQKNQLLKIANGCPIHKILSGEIRIHTRLHD